MIDARTLKEGHSGGNPGEVGADFLRDYSPEVWVYVADSQHTGFIDE